MMTDEEFIAAAKNIMEHTTSLFMQSFCKKSLELAKRPRNRAEELAYLRKIETQRNYEKRRALRR